MDSHVPQEAQSSIVVALINDRSKAKLIIPPEKLGRLRNSTMVYGSTVLSVITVEMTDRKKWLAHDPQNIGTKLDKNLPLIGPAKYFSHQQAVFVSTNIYQGPVACLVLSEILRSQDRTNWILEAGLPQWLS